MKICECQIGKLYRLTSFYEPPANHLANRLIGLTFRREAEHLRFFLPAKADEIALTEDWTLPLPGFCEPLFAPTNTVPYNQDPVNEADYKLSYDTFEELDATVNDCLRKLTELEGWIKSFKQNKVLVDTMMELRGGILKSLGLLSEAKQ